MCFKVVLTSFFCIYNTGVLKGVNIVAIDYADIGMRIKQKRIEKRLTQEQLSEMIGVGASHMSHMESGKTVPSMEVFITLCNVLGCSADELLCREISAARPLLNNWLTDLVADCDATETKILTDVLVSTKSTLRKNKTVE